MSQLLDVSEVKYGERSIFFFPAHLNFDLKNIVDWGKNIFFNTHRSNTRDTSNLIVKNFSKHTGMDKLS